MGQSDDTVCTMMPNFPIAIYCNQTPMSATVSKMEGRSKARGHSTVGNWIRMTLTRRGRARDQLSVHEVVHILTVLAALPREALLNGSCGREVRNTAIPR